MTRCPFRLPCLLNGLFVLAIIASILTESFLDMGQDANIRPSTLTHSSSFKIHCIQFPTHLLVQVLTI